MDKETIEDIMQKLLRQIECFNENPDYDKAKMVDQQISVLRFCIGESNFLPLHYFRAAHEAAVKYIDEHDKAKAKENAQ